MCGSDDAVAGWGAGLCVSNGTLTMVDGVVEGNGRKEAASVGGGGIYACGGSDVFVEGGSVRKNELFGKEGAGIGVDEFSTLVVANATVSDNRARLSGAGIAVADSKATIDGAAIENNFTYGSGAGLYVGEGATVRMLSGCINNNRCRVDGGGVEVAFGGSFHMSDGEISGNLAWVGNNLQASAGEDEMGPLEDGGVTAGHSSMGGGIDARGDLYVSGGTIASNGAIVGCGICFNCERWDTERHGLTLSGAPLFKDNYLSWARYGETDVTIYMDGSEDESALVRVDVSLRPPLPIRIEKRYRANWDAIALVDEGDYEVGAFMSVQGVTWESSSPYTLAKRNGVLYAVLRKDAVADRPSPESPGFGGGAPGALLPTRPLERAPARPHPGVYVPDRGLRGTLQRQVVWAPAPVDTGLRRGSAVRYPISSMGRTFATRGRYVPSGVYGWRQVTGYERGMVAGSGPLPFASFYGVRPAGPMSRTYGMGPWAYPLSLTPWMRYGQGRSANTFATALLGWPGYAGLAWQNPYGGAWGSWW